MESGDIDQIKETVMSNPLGEEGGRNDLKMKDYVFMPIVEMVDKSPFEKMKHLDIWDGDPYNKKFDIEKLYDYTTWVY
jgi:hypothetical protein